MQDKIYEGLDFQAYRAIEAINVSGLKLFKRSPAHFFAHVVTGDAHRKQTPAMKLGEAIHCACLERAEFENRYIAEPKDAPRRPTVAQLNAKKPSYDTLAQIDFWEKFDELAAGKITLTPEDFERVLAVAKTFWNHPAAEEFLKESKTELTLVWTDEETGLKCKARVDAAVPGSGLFDLKSTIDASEAEFPRQFFKLGYHMQAAWYVDGWKVLTGEELPFLFIAQEKDEPPYESAWYMADDEAIDEGRATVRAYLKQYAECLKTQKWPGYKKEIISLSLPTWMQAKKTKAEEY